MYKNWFIINGFFALMTVLGFFYGFVWAKAISVGIGWMYSICSCIFFSKTIRYITIIKNQKVANHMLDLMFDVCIASIFFYSGHLYLAGFYTAHIIIIMQYRADLKHFKKVGFKDPEFAKVRNKI